MSTLEVPAGYDRILTQIMRSFAEAWPDESSIVQQAVGQLPWGHIMLLIDKLDAREDRDWYASRAVHEGWSRAALEHNIMGRLQQRVGAAPSSFDGQLDERDARVAQALSRDPYVFDFLGLAQGAAERALGQAMMDRIVDVLRELGPGWAFVDRQKHVEIDGDDFHLDLLFFHTEQLRYVVFELKAGRFRPEYTGQLGFYVAVVDDLIRRAAGAAGCRSDQPRARRARPGVAGEGLERAAHRSARASRSGCASCARSTARAGARSCTCRAACRR